MKNLLLCGLLTGISYAAFAEYTVPLTFTSESTVNKVAALITESQSFDGSNSISTTNGISSISFNFNGDNVSNGQPFATPTTWVAALMNNSGLTPTSNIDPMRQPLSPPSPFADIDVINLLQVTINLSISTDQYQCNNIGLIYLPGAVELNNNWFNGWMLLSNINTTHYNYAFDTFRSYVAVESCTDVTTNQPASLYVSATQGILHSFNWSTTPPQY
jgi:hypothetical protein